MRNIEQYELMTVAAGVSPVHADHKQAQPEAGFKEDLFIEGLKIVLNLAITAIWTTLFPPKEQNKEPNKEKDKENKDARYRHSSMAPF